MNSNEPVVSRTLKVEQTDLFVTTYFSWTSVLVCWQNIAYGLLMRDIIIADMSNTAQRLVMMFFILIRNESWLLKQLFTRFAPIWNRDTLIQKGILNGIYLEKKFYLFIYVLHVCTYIMFKFFRLCGIMVSISHLGGCYSVSSWKTYKINSDNIYYLIALSEDLWRSLNAMSQNNNSWQMSRQKWWQFLEYRASSNIWWK